MENNQKDMQHKKDQNYVFSIAVILIELCIQEL